MKGNLRLPTQGTKGNSPPEDPAFHCSGSKCLKCHPVHYTCKFPFLACSLAFLNRSFVFFHPEPFRSLKILSKNYRNIKTGWLIQWMSPSEDPNLHDLVSSGYSLCHFSYFGGKKPIYFIVPGFQGINADFLTGCFLYCLILFSINTFLFTLFSK